MLSEKQIFIHVPKTGGTTLNCTLHDTEHPQEASFNFRHIVTETQLSNCGDIFNPLKNDKYRNHKIFMMLRHPVDRIVSEYYFIKERDMFFSKLKPQPKNFKEYALHRQTSNYIVSFLLGKEIYSPSRPSMDDLNQVIAAIEELNITIGIFEHFQQSLDLFQKEIGVKWPKKIENKRVTLIRLAREKVSADLANKIEAHHHLDLKLYNYALERFKQYKKLSNQVVKFKENRYDYVLTYANGNFILDMVIKGHPFISRYQTYFNELRRFLSSAKLTSGEEYLAQWKGALINAIKENDLKPNLQAFIARHENDHPIEFIQAFGSWVKESKDMDWKDLKLNFKRSQVPRSSIFNLINKWFT